ncbi:MAG: signal peptide peptidase SppA [Candidatus Rokubacteria bacterium]|nr:signal peptide peptidase SppA [Candidatus Rokubacteria bacterium]
MLHRLVVAFLAVLVGGCSVISIDLSPRVRPLREETVEGDGKAKILLTDVSGFLSEDTPGVTLPFASPPPRVPRLVRFREELKKAAKDEDVRAVVLRINSPGGTVTASDVMFRELELFRKERRVPIVAVMMDVAASGGYYVALAADTIVAHPTTVTGSIGVIMITMNAQGLLEKIGVSASAIKSGARKDMGSPFRTLTEEERAIFQSVIDDLHQQFVTKVVERRRIPRETAQRLADGRIFTADQALSQRLVDRLGYLPDAIEVAKRAAGVEQARVIVYHRPREYRATYYAQAATPEPAAPISFASLAALLSPGPRFLYVWWP